MNDKVNLGLILMEHVLPELNTPSLDELPVVKARSCVCVRARGCSATRVLVPGDHVQAACLKFFATFRNQFSCEQLKALLPIIAQYSRAKSFVVHTYAASAVERVLILKDRMQAPEGAWVSRALRLRPAMSWRQAVCVRVCRPCWAHGGRAPPAT